ncbi:hypothetical protein Tco_1115230 [Tanacetum coccineum]
MIKPEKPLKMKEQIRLDEELALKLQAEEQEEDRLAREKSQQVEDANIAEWDDVQAMMDADYELAARLQAEEQGELTIKERLKLFMELMDKRKKHFARLRAEERRRKPPTKAQKRNQIYSFVPIDSEVVKGSKDRAEGSETRAEGSDKVAINAIPLATKPAPIIDFQIHTKRLVKVKHGNTRLEEAYERVLWGDLKVMFEPDIESEGRIIRIERLHDVLEVAAAKYKVKTAQLKLVLLVENEENILSSYYFLYTVSAAGTKVNAAERLQLLEEFLLSEG